VADLNKDGTPENHFRNVFTHRERWTFDRASRKPRVRSSSNGHAHESIEPVVANGIGVSRSTDDRRRRR